ncbi:MAG: histidine kinase [Aeromicrobium sp.]
MEHAVTAAARMGRVGAWLVAPLFIGGMVLFEQRIADSGRDDLLTLNSVSALPLMVANLSCWLVGVVLTWRVTHHVVGWLFLGLASAMTAGGFLDVYANDSLRAEPHTFPLGAYAAVGGDTIFVWWFLFVALILQLTPTGQPLTKPWARLTGITILSSFAFFVAVLLRSTPLEGENAGLVSPWAVPGLAGLLAGAGLVAILTLGLCLLTSAGVLLVRFRRSQGDERRQLLWLVGGVTPLPLCLAVSFASAFAHNELLAGASISIGIVALAVGAGFSVAKYRLYGVEHVVSGAVAYMLASAAIVAMYGAVTLALTRNIPGVRTSSTLTTVLATLAAAGVALPAYHWARDAVDRRFNRRRFDAVHVVKVGLQQDSPDLGALMIAALGDPTVRIIFPGGDSGWVAPDGSPVQPGDNVVVVARRGSAAARIEFDPKRTDRNIVEAVAQQAAAEIDNLGLRAELARKLQDVSMSRSRLAGAHLEERKRMERDLHDGAQQRLLAIALQLQSARVNGSPELLQQEADRAVVHLGIAVQELRDLANGLQPASLAGGGLRAAVEELAVRIPLTFKLDVIDRRFDPVIEGAAWFVIAEAVSNVVKHAGVDAVRIDVGLESSGLRVTVEDEGAGGANRRGRGLQGLADRVAALGGRLAIDDRGPHGTRVEALFPCE